jgi:putative endonuclease
MLVNQQSVVASNPTRAANLAGVRVPPTATCFFVPPKVNKQTPPFLTCILQNPAGRFYIGHTEDLERRLAQHNDPAGKSHLGKFTHKTGPWKLVWSEHHPTRSDAMQREREIKAWKSAIRIRRELLQRESL